MQRCDAVTKQNVLGGKLEYGRQFYLILESLVYPLQIFKVAEKSGRVKIRGVYYVKYS